MTEIRRDPLRMRWVLIDPEQPVRPEALKTECADSADEGGCPLCPGNEAVQGPQLYFACGYGRERSGRDSCVKVVPNGRPLLRVERELVRSAKGPYDLVSGAGAHEVVIETPDHGVPTADLDQEAIAQVFTAIRARMADLRNDVRLRYHLYFKQQGRQAGARFSHAHGQLLATPEIPPFIAAEVENALDHHARKERCLFCDILAFEAESGARFVSETSRFSVFVPYASARPFELWIIPKRHSHDFVDIGYEDARELARVLKGSLSALRSALDDPPFSLTLVNSPTPHHPAGMNGRWSALPNAFHWRLAIVPRMTMITGMDWDTGMSVNPVAPEKAAAWLRREGGAG